MVVQVNIAEAKAKLSELVARAERGEEVVIARRGKPVVTLTAKAAVDPAPTKGKRRLGVWAHYGPLTDPDLFLRPDPELEAAADERILPEAYPS
jgi:prevent-host-death family protein